VGGKRHWAIREHVVTVALGRPAEHSSAILPPKTNASPARPLRLGRLGPLRSVYNTHPMDLGLTNRVAIVAASSQGIGKATAEAFAAEGCRIAICARNQQTLHSVADSIDKQYGVEVYPEAFDVTDALAVKKFVDAVVARFGSADICVTNAGGPPAKGFLATTQEEWKKAVDQNFLSAVYFAREVIPHMQRKHWGRIITITSITTKQPVADLVLSNAVRAAVVGLVKSLANEFGKDGILVNNVGPGYTATDRLKELAKSRSATSGKTEQEIFDSWAIDAPLKRLGEPREVAETIVWLASERASYITGQTILVDGGIYKGL
jgi:3-oxoacyl-[acyl-carrier protein] reductase